MSKKVVILGGGTGTSTLVRGLKEFPIDISVVVSVCDDGSSTGKLRKEFDVPAVGDLRNVLSALSDTEPLFESLLEYRFNTSSDLNGHAIGNLLLVALCNITGNMSDGIKSLSKVLNIKGNVLPLTEDNVVLMGNMNDGKVIEGEHNITEYKENIKDIYYKEEPKINPEVLDAIKSADMIILSMGSLYTSIIPNLLCKDVVKAIENSNAKIIYVCNVVTQPGETDNFKASDHVKLLNKYLGKRKVDILITNSEEIDPEIVKIYETQEQKDLVVVDSNNIKIEHINKPLIKVENNIIRHDNVKLALEIMNILIK